MNLRVQGLHPYITSYPIWIVEATILVVISLRILVKVVTLYVVITVQVDVWVLCGVKDQLVAQTQGVEDVGLKPHFLAVL